MATRKFLDVAAGMTMRERMLALIQGREQNRVPFVMYESAP